MDMEHLSKSQIVLLTLLVSFFTSIATGIVTVSLMDQAPPVVSQIVNRVIEKTVETVTAPTQKGQTATTIVTQEKTVVIKESDQIAKAVDRTSMSLVRIYTSDSAEAAFIGIGIVLDAGGTIIADTGALDEHADVSLVLPDGSRVRAFVTRRDSSVGLAFLQSATTTETQAGPKTIVWKPIAIATDRPVLGSSAVALSGKTSSRIGDGLVTSLIKTEGGYVIDTNITESSIMKGSPLIDTSGNLIGVSTGVARSSSSQGFIVASVLLAPAKKD